MTTTLQKYLQENQIPFSSNELTEPIIMVYNILKWCIRDQTPIIELSANNVNRKREEREAPWDTFTIRIDFRPVFESVLAKDEVIRKHLKLLNKTKTQTIYIIILSQNR